MRQPKTCLPLRRVAPQKKHAFYSCTVVTLRVALKCTDLDHRTLLPPHNVRDSPTIAYNPQELPPWSMHVILVSVKPSTPLCPSLTTTSFLKLSWICHTYEYRKWCHHANPTKVSAHPFKLQHTNANGSPLQLPRLDIHHHQYLHGTRSRVDIKLPHCHHQEANAGHNLVSTITKHRSQGESVTAAW
ncbi:hypothetical protein EI94DRAFT_647936 [Lactarius quietus]|nr:hypothetical protein EI94DRAFT_647936 [Lactarius quietus]